MREERRKGRRGRRRGEEEKKVEKFLWRNLLYCKMNSGLQIPSNIYSKKKKKIQLKKKEENKK